MALDERDYMIDRIKRREGGAVAGRSAPRPAQRARGGASWGPWIAVAACIAFGIILAALWHARRGLGS